MNKSEALEQYARVCEERGKLAKVVEELDHKAQELRKFILGPLGYGRPSADIVAGRRAYKGRVLTAPNGVPMSTMDFLRQNGGRVTADEVASFFRIPRAKANHRLYNLKRSANLNHGTLIVYENGVATLMEDNHVTK